MQKFLRSGPLISALVLSACAATTAPPLPDGDDVPLGRSAYVDGPVVKPIAVIEDSRCPAGVQCIWAGRVRLKMAWLRGNGELQPFELTLGEPAPLADGIISLEAVRPERRDNAAIAPQDYRFSFRFSGGL